MSGKSPEHLRSDLESLGWNCHEVLRESDWHVTVVLDDRSIVSIGRHRQLVWNAAYRDAIKHSAGNA